MVTIKKDGPSLDAEFDTHNIQPKMDLETLSTKKKKKKKMDLETTKLCLFSI